MNIKRAPPKTVLVLTFEEHQRVSQVVGLLFNVAQRVATTKRKKAQSPKKDKMVREYRGPCFFEQLIYHIKVDLIIYKEITMIDTIVLIFSSDMYRIIDPDKFTPTARWVENLFITQGAVSKQNVTKKELSRGIYKPYLTLSKRRNFNGHHDIILKVELSLPKLLFGNNFQELQYKDFSTIAHLLQEKLEEMGVAMSLDTLSQAPVAAVHYAKNIVLQDGSTPYHYIQKIKESNVTLALDTNEIDYRNDGYSFKWHCNSYEVVFYDKIKELEKAKQRSKRTIEKDGILQLKLLDRLAHRKKLEILRMEVRLNRRKIKQLLTKLGIKANLTFKGLFKPAVAKKVLLHYLQELESKRPALLDFKAKSDEALLVALRVNNPELGPKQILQMFGLKKALECMTPRELRVLFARFHPRSWYRLMADAKKVRLPMASSPFDVVRQQIINFKPCKL